MSSKTRSEQAATDTRWRASREAALDRRFSRDGVDHGPNETSPRERSRSTGDSLRPRHHRTGVVSFFESRFGNAGVEPTCSLGASERR